MKCVIMHDRPLLFISNRHAHLRPAYLLILLLGVTPLLCFGGGKRPIPLTSKHDIESATPDVDDVFATRLPLEDFPRLSKFKGLRAVRLGSGATDAKLEALAKLKLTNLDDINMVGAPAVTDVGIIALTNIVSLKSIGIEGTGITDAACEVMASRMRLQGVNVANCDGVSKNGINALGRSDTIKELGFSADNLSQEEIVELIASFKNVSWCQIVDPKRKLDARALKEKGSGRKIHVAVVPMGAMQSMGLRR